MIDSEMGTQHFKTISENPQDAQTILLCVYHALSAKGYDPITQIVGYLISGDPTYITGYQNARSLICRIDRDELLEELVQFYLSKRCKGNSMNERIDRAGCGRPPHWHRGQRCRWGLPRSRSRHIRVLAMGRMCAESAKLHSNMKPIASSAVAA